MASGLSRRCIGALRSQPSIGLTFAGTSRLSGWDQNITTSRRYTTPARHKQKTSGTAKGTSKTAALKSAPTPKVSTKASAATTQATPAAKGARKGEVPGGSSNAVSRGSTPEHQLHTAPSIPKKNSTKLNQIGGLAYKAGGQKEEKVLTEEEQIAQMDYLMAMSKLFPTADLWGQSVDTFGGSWSTVPP
jgi:protein MBA1